jgi:hypothetical protein
MIKRILVILLLLSSFLLTSCGEVSTDPIIGNRYFEGTIYIWDGLAWQPVSTSSSNVTAAAIIADTTIVRGDGGGRGVQDSGVTIDGFDNLNTNGGDLTGFDINATNDVNVTNDLEVTSQADIGGQLTVDDQIHITGNYPIKWMDMTDTTTFAYIHFDGNLTIRESDAGAIVIDADTGNITMDSDVELRGDGRVYNTTWVDAGGIKAPGAKPALAIAHGVLETPAWQFEDAVTLNEESISFLIRIPERMDRSEEPYLIVGWSSTATSANCTWQLEYLWTALNQDTTAGAEETLTILSLSSATAEGMNSATFTGINTPSDTDFCLHCRLTRKSGSATDTIADVVELHGICFRWVSNKLGGKM